jgi:Glycoside hydrolase family 2 C-terminal domain 5/F5/8 type C domain/Domain of unknown function (DUF4982)
MTVLSNFHTPEEKARAAAELKALGKIKVPSRSSYFGILDLAGFPKDRFFLYQAHWRPELPMAHILPHWNWPERVGQATPVFVYTSGDEAELFLNGKSQGRLCKAPKKTGLSDPDDLAYGKPASASTEEGGNVAANAVSATSKRWCASSGNKNEWLQVDLGNDEPLRTLVVTFEKPQTSYRYDIKGSVDGSTWQPLVAEANGSGEGLTATHSVQGRARYIHVTITDLLTPATWASIQSLGVFSVDKKPAPSSLAGAAKGVVTDEHYRLRWNNVVYEPGELRVVAYKEGKPWAEDVMKTAGAAAKLLLNPDRSDIKADGQDLSFVTVTITDSLGVLVPRSKNVVEFEISGPGEIVAVDNGDATSFESFKGSQHSAYNGLALVVLRSKLGQTGNITLTAKSTGLQSEKRVIRANE